jgi:hypothetical protein
MFLIFLQLVDTAAKQIRELRHQLDRPSVFSSPARSYEPSSPGPRGRASLDRRGSNSRRSALSSNDKNMPSGESMVAGTGLVPSRL